MTGLQPWWRVAGMATGMLLVQIAWAMCVPPFGGMDEWDHAFRADAVAHGQWRAAATEATRGTGGFVEVSPALVAAAASECAVLPYTTDVECEGTPQDGRVVVASGAGRYNPIFYAFIGSAALPFNGTSALYVMRAGAALLTLGLLVVALMCIRCWALSPWPFLAVAVGLTPSLLYSSIIAAPNGVEMTAGLAWWSALMGLAIPGEPTRRPLLLVAAAGSGSILITARSLGPMWAVLALVTVVIATPGSVRRLRAVARTTLGVAAILALSLSSVASVAWILSQRSLKIGAGGWDEGAGPSFATRIAKALGSETVWVLQTIGAFPYRGESAPAAVYILLPLLLFGVAVVAFKRAEQRLRQAMSVSFAVLILVPFCITFATYGSFGVAWQGRYALPYALGLAILTGAALNSTKFFGPRILVPALAIYLAGQMLGPLQVLSEQRDRPSVLESGAWLPPAPVVVLLLALGFTLLWFAASWSPAAKKTAKLGAQ